MRYGTFAHWIDRDLSSPNKMQSELFMFQYQDDLPNPNSMDSVVPGKALFSICKLL